MGIKGAYLSFVFEGLCWFNDIGNSRWLDIDFYLGNIISIYLNAIRMQTKLHDGLRISGKENSRKNIELKLIESTAYLNSNEFTELITIHGFHGINYYSRKFQYIMSSSNEIC